jgi:hypothetical protein
LSFARSSRTSGGVAGCFKATMTRPVGLGAASVGAICRLASPIVSKSVQFVCRIIPSVGEKAPADE